MRLALQWAANVLAGIAGASFVAGLGLTVAGAWLSDMSVALTGAAAYAGAAASTTAAYWVLKLEAQLDGAE